MKPNGLPLSCGRNWIRCKREAENAPAWRAPEIESSLVARLALAANTASAFELRSDDVG